MALSAVSTLISISFASMSIYWTMIEKSSDLEWTVQMSLIGVNIVAMINNIFLLLMASNLVCGVTSSIRSNDPISTVAITSSYLPSPHQIMKSTVNVGVSTQSFIQAKKFNN